MKAGNRFYVAESFLVNIKWSCSKKNIFNSEGRFMMTVFMSAGLWSLAWFTWMQDTFLHHTFRFNIILPFYKWCHSCRFRFEKKKSESNVNSLVMMGLKLWSWRLASVVLQNQTDSVWYKYVLNGASLNFVVSRAAVLCCQFYVVYSLVGAKRVLVLLTNTFILITSFLI